jgi:outer membrane protein W
MQRVVISICISFFVFGLFSSAQSQFRMGVTAGVNIASIDWTNYHDEEEYGSRIGLVAGLKIAYEINDHISLSFLPCYVMKGQDTEEQPGLTSLGYVELPVSVQFYLLDGTLRPYVFSGLAPAFIISAEYENNVNSEDFKDNFKELDFLFHIGAGVELVVDDDMSITFDAMFNRGLTNILDVDKDINRDGIEWSTSDIMVCAGVIVGI